MIPLGAIVFIAGSSSAFAAILSFCGEESTCVTATTI